MTRIHVVYGPPHPDTAWLTSHGLARCRQQHHHWSLYYRHVLLMLAAVGTVLAIVYWAGGSIRLP